ncbi:unnamed protein product [Lactuca virosa]|uniref:ALOG domain-containing protein n=1 Tax=Lactuca virosa TaxID=75947 RepID=A0AAU9LY53_9ASTR|nr:unnamed protein product [Lactuca virosa]
MVGEEGETMDFTLCRLEVEGGALESPTGRSRSQATTTQSLSRYESQKRRDWNTFLQYLKNYKPPLTLARCNDAHVIEFLKYLDQFGKTKVHVIGCPCFGYPNPPVSCACPLKQAWGILDTLIGRLRVSYEENDVSTTYHCSTEREEPYLLFIQSDLGLVREEIFVQWK